MTTRPRDGTRRILAPLYAGLALAADVPSPALLVRSRENALLAGLGVAARTLDASPFPDLFDRLWDLLGEADAAALLRRLRIEHCRLFHGPPRALVLPYAGSWIGEGSPDAAPDAVRRCYREAGLAPARDVRDRPDHLATELEFLAAVCAAQAPGTTAREPPGIDPVVAGRTHRAFLAEHALHWMPALAEAVVERSRLAFYQLFGRALLATLDLDAGRVPHDATERNR